MVTEPSQPLVVNESEKERNLRKNAEFEAKIRGEALNTTGNTLDTLPDSIDPNRRGPTREFKFVCTVFAFMVFTLVGGAGIALMLTAG